MKNSAKKSSSVKKVLKKIKPYSFYLILALVSAIISVSLTLYIPVLTGNAIDNIIDKGNVDFASVIQILQRLCPHMKKPLQFSDCRYAPQHMTRCHR